MKTKNGKDERFQQTPEQRNPYLARPEHFEIVGEDKGLPFHGQCGNTQREYATLLNNRDARGKSRPRGKGQDLTPQAKRRGKVLTLRDSDASE